MSEKLVTLAFDNEPPKDPDSNEALVERAWQAALYGSISLPVFLHLYSLWLILKVFSRGETLSKSGSYKMYGALALDGAVLVVAPILLIEMASLWI